MGYYVDTYVLCLLFYPCEDYVNLAGAIDFYFSFVNYGLLVFITRIFKVLNFPCFWEMRYY